MIMMFLTHQSLYVLQESASSSIVEATAIVGPPSISRWSGCAFCFSMMLLSHETVGILRELTELRIPESRLTAVESRDSKEPTRAYGDSIFSHD